MGFFGGGAADFREAKHRDSDVPGQLMFYLAPIWNLLCSARSEWMQIFHESSPFKCPHRTDQATSTGSMEIVVGHR